MVMASPLLPLLLMLLVPGGQSWRSPFPRPPPPPLEQGAGPPPEPLWFEQLLDHFNVRDDRWAASYTHSSTTVSISLYLPPQGVAAEVLGGLGALPPRRPRVPADRRRGRGDFA